MACVLIYLDAEEIRDATNCELAEVQSMAQHMARFYSSNSQSEIQQKKGGQKDHLSTSPMHVWGKGCW